MKVCHVTEHVHAATDMQTFTYIMDVPGRKTPEFGQTGFSKMHSARNIRLRRCRI